MRARTARGRRVARRGERGAALLVAMVAIAVLTAMAVDLAYDNRVRLQLAADGRDALRAEALANSGVNMARLVLAFQQQVDQASAQMCAPLQQLTGGQGMGCPRPQLWSVLPVNSGLVQALFGGGAAPPREGDEDRKGAAGGAKAPVARFGDFEGAFDAKIQDEGAKVNVQLDSIYDQTGTLGVQVESILRLVCEPRWDALFDREGTDGQRWSRQDLLVHLRDWADGDPTASTLLASFPGGGGCSFVVPQKPFEAGSGDENAPYDRGPDRYQAKNARLDSLDELHLVAGVSDAFLAAFGDQLTVYLPRDGNGAFMNVNTSDPAQELRIARLMADPAALPLLDDAAFPERLHKALADARQGGLLSVTPQTFALILGALNVPVRPEYMQANNPKSPFTDRSVAFRILAAGVAGNVTRTIDAVVTFDPSQAQGDPLAGKPLPGRLVHWKLE